MNRFEREALNAVATAIAEVIGPAVAYTEPDEYNRLMAEGKIIHDPNTDLIVIERGEPCD